MNAPVALQDPVSGEALTWRGLAHRSGAWATSAGRAYPVTNGVCRMDGGGTAGAVVLEALGLAPMSAVAMQAAETVESFGFQWSWDSAPRTESDLQWRVADRYHLPSNFFADKIVLDAGCGAGAQSAFLARQHARVIALDLSRAIDVAASLPELQQAVLLQGDLAHLPLKSASLDVVYCEGVLQHTADMEPILREFARVLRSGGTLLAAHYLMPEDPLRKAQWAVREGIRQSVRRVPRDALFLASGIAAAASFVPLIGPILKKTVVIANHRMPTLKATWSATYDAYGLHEYQRYLPHREFVARVEASGFAAADVGEPGVLRAERLP